jgi:lipoprotein signal peptidase
MAPILSFTAEEAWRIVHPADASIFCRTWAETLPRIEDEEALVAKWARILAVRAAVLKELETLRQGGKVGSSLQAEVALTAAGGDYEALASLGDDLRFVLITSAATVRRGEALRDRGIAKRPTPNASAAGITARTSAATRDTPRFARAAFRISSAPANRACSRERSTHAAHHSAAARAAMGRWLWLSALVIAADQATKAAILATLREGDAIAVTPFFSIVLTFNTGAAFSFLSSASGWQRWFFVAIAVAAAVVIVVLLRRGGSLWYQAGSALILGGALGNVYDRLTLGKSSTSCCSTMPDGRIRRSTSPTAQSPSARRS